MTCVCVGPSLHLDNTHFILTTPPSHNWGKSVCIFSDFLRSSSHVHPNGRDLNLRSLHLYSACPAGLLRVTHSVCRSLHKSMGSVRVATGLGMIPRLGEKRKLLRGDGSAECSGNRVTMEPFSLQAWAQLCGCMCLCFYIQRICQVFLDEKPVSLCSCIVPAFSTHTKGFVL